MKLTGFFFLVFGVKYLHSLGVAHKDLNPGFFFFFLIFFFLENLLLDSSRKILKITDFGVSEVFRAPFASVCQKAKGRCGSGPYIAPEEFLGQEYDAQMVDVWAIGII
jgi:protein-serine/threonine kinase